MTTLFSIAKVNTLPSNYDSTYDPSTMYIVPNSNNAYADIYISDSQGISVKKIVSVDDLSSFSISNIEFYATYNDLPKTQATLPTKNTLAYVYDVSADSSVPSGSAGGGYYIFDYQQYTQIGGGYSWELTTLDKTPWDYITGVPTVLTGFGVNSTDELTYNSAVLVQADKIDYVNIASEAW